MAKLNFNIFNRAGTAPDKPARRGFGYSAGTSVNEDSAMKVSAAYRGLMYISTQVAKLPWNVKDAQNNVLDNEIAKILNTAPNKEMNAFTFRLFMVQQAIIHGNAYAEIVRDFAGRPKELHIFNTADVEPVRDLDGRLWYRIVGGSKSDKGGDVYLKPSDVFHVRNFHTKDGISGQGFVTYAIDILGISLGADGFANSLYANGGMPSGILTMPGTLADEAYERLKKSWKENHGGRKTGGVAILEEGLTFQPVTFTPDVMQFLESRKFNVLEIARFLGVPPSKLFDSGSMTYNNIEHANLEVATDTLDAWARNLESEADVKLLNYNHSGRKTELDLYAVFRGDMKTRSDYFNKMLQNGAITSNEIRTKEGYAPYEGGDEYYIATNNFSPVRRLNEIIDAQISKGAPVEPKKDETEEELKAAAAKYLKKRNI